jgi:hypothetical protein
MCFKRFQKELYASEFLEREEAYRYGGTTNLDVDEIPAGVSLLRVPLDWITLQQPLLRVPDLAMTVPYLTKSRYLAGLQCGRRLWRMVHEPHSYEPPAPGSTFDIGAEIGIKAQSLFPGGITVSAEPWQHAEAVSQTARLLGNPRVPAIFEAAFEHDNIRVRVDILKRQSDGSWGFIEVKSSTGLKDHYLDDIALQVHVLLSLGIAVSSVELMHVNTAYIRGPDGIDWEQFFWRLDLAREVQKRLGELAFNLGTVRDYSVQSSLPFVTPGKQCNSPYACEFWEDCTADKPDDWVAKMPRLSARQAEELEALGVESIAQIPADFRLTARQGVIRDAIMSGEIFVAPDLGRLLHRFGPPALYLDFEAMMPAIPLYAGTRPYQTLPFQWSLHGLAADGSLTHKEYLATGVFDPRREFAETLIEAVAGSDLPIIVYSAYEQTRLKALAVDFPDLAPRLQSIINRLADLLPIVRGAIYHPDFQFSNSIKKVGPALSPGFGYDDLDGIADGSAAAAAFVELASGFISDSTEVQRLRSAFLAYCKRDTLAMVEVHKALIALAAGPRQEYLNKQRGA